MRSILITSPTNPTIKELVRLKDRKGDRAARSFVVEGLREIERAIASGFSLEDLFYCPEELKTKGFAIVESARDSRLAEVSKEAFSKVATRDGSDGLIGVFGIRSATFNDILKKTNGRSPFILAVENVEKPGNLGAILRTADGAGVHGVIVLGHTVDPWNSNVIRSSLGGVFSVPVLNCESSDFFNWCQDNKIRTVAAALTERSRSLYETNLKGAIAVVLGSEAHGLTEDSVARCGESVVIPMNGTCDSLNVSVAAGIFVYEALRQNHL